MNNTLKSSEEKVAEAFDRSVFGPDAERELAEARARIETVDAMRRSVGNNAKQCD